VYIDGKSVILATGLVLRDEDAQDSYVQGLHFQTFFGGMSVFCNLSILLGSSDITDVLIGNSGHSPEWASPRDQRAWFAGVSGAIIGPDRQGLGSALHDEL
jgi:hypothetical protein